MSGMCASGMRASEMLSIGREKSTTGMEDACEWDTCERRDACDAYEWDACQSYVYRCGCV